MTKVGLIEIATDNDNYAYAIFETMNDRGKPLSPVDMLKAYLLAPIEDPELRRLANQTWKKQVLDLISWGSDHDAERDSACIKAWLRSQFAETKREGKAGSTDKDWELIGSVFHRWVRDNSSRIGLGKDERNLDMIRKDLPFFSGVYQQILGASRTYTPGLEAIFYLIFRNEIKMTTQGLLPNDLIDENGLLKQLTKALVERSLQTKMTEHLGHGLNFDSLNPLPYRSLVIQ